MSDNFYREIIRLLKDAGFYLHRHGKGSHEIWMNDRLKSDVTVPRNLYVRHTANGILKKAGIKKKL